MNAMVDIKELTDMDTITVSREDLMMLVSFNQGFIHAMNDLSVLFSVIAERTCEHSKEHVLAMIGQKIADDWDDACTNEVDLVRRLSKALANH